MRYDVFWTPTAERQLAELWVSAIDRGAVAEAADQIDALLLTDAGTAGESRAENERIVIVRPLAAFIEIDGTGRRVIVRGLRRF